MLIVRATKKLRQRLGSTVPDNDELSTLLGDRSATALLYRRHPSPDRELQAFLLSG